MDPQIGERLAELTGLLKKVEEIDSQQKETTSILNKAKEKQPSKGQQKQKLKQLYTNTIQSHELESKSLREALEVVIDIRKTLRQYQKKLIATVNNSQSSIGGVRRGALMKILQQSASALPLYIPERPTDPVPHLCGRIPADQSFVASAGDLVAAFVPSPDGDGSKVWVLGEVLDYTSGSGKYEIDDIDEEQKERHSIGRRRVIPLPIMRANPRTNPEALFPKDTLVLALYPQTTCFYRAMIDKSPEDPSHDYMVSFEDATYTEGFSPPLAVPQRYVIASRDPKKWLSLYDLTEFQHNQEISTKILVIQLQTRNMSSSLNTNQDRWWIEMIMDIQDRFSLCQRLDLKRGQIIRIANHGSLVPCSG